VCRGPRQIPSLPISQIPEHAKQEEEEEDGELASAIPHKCLASGRAAEHESSPQPPLREGHRLRNGIVSSAPPPPLQPLHSYTPQPFIPTVKMVNIQDARLGVLKIALLFAITIYIAVFQLWRDGGLVRASAKKVLRPMKLSSSGANETPPLTLLIGSQISGDGESVRRGQIHSAAAYDRQRRQPELRPQERQLLQRLRRSLHSPVLRSVHPAIRRQQVRRPPPREHREDCRC
jgi:hypothetical protein